MQAIAHSRERQNSYQRGYTRKWSIERTAYLDRPENALCVHCKRRGYIVPSRVVDHIIPHQGDQKLFWDRKNWQPLCEACHNSKSAKEESKSVYIKGCDRKGLPLDPNHPWNKEKTHG